MVSPKGFYASHDLMISLSFIFLIVRVDGRMMNGRVNISNHLLTSISTPHPSLQYDTKRGLKEWWKMGEIMIISMN